MKKRSVLILLLFISVSIVAAVFMPLVSLAASELMNIDFQNYDASVHGMYPPGTSSSYTAPLYVMKSSAATATYTGVQGPGKDPDNICMKVEGSGTSQYSFLWRLIATPENLGSGIYELSGDIYMEDNNVIRRDLFMLKYSNAPDSDVDFATLSFRNDGYVYYGNGGTTVKSSIQYLTKKWYKVRVALDFNTGRYSSYLTDMTDNGQEIVVANNAMLRDLSFLYFNTRLEVIQTNTSSITYLDNLRIAEVPPDSIECTILPFFNDKGKGTAEIGSSTYIDTSVMLKNNFKENKNAVMAVGIYNNRRLIDVLLVKPEASDEMVGAGQAVTLAKRVFIADYPDMTDMKVFAWDSLASMKPFVPFASIGGVSHSDLIFHSGFEAGTTVITQNPGDSHETVSITGTDKSFSSFNNWQTDLEDYPDFGIFKIQYNPGIISERSATIVDDPVTGAGNKVLRFFAGSVTSPNDRVRVQANMYGNSSSLTEIYYKYRMYLHTDFNKLKSYSETFNWLTLAEFWSQTNWMDLPYPYRVSLNLKKVTTGTVDNLYFTVYGEKAAIYPYDKVWEYTNTTYPVPVGRWLTCEVWYKQGDNNTGRFYYTITPEGGTKQIIFDITGYTYHPDNPSPDGLQYFCPIKLYTSRTVANYVRDNGGALQVYWDDIEFRTTRP